MILMPFSSLIDDESIPIVVEVFSGKEGENPDFLGEVILPLDVIRVLLVFDELSVPDCEQRANGQPSFYELKDKQRDAVGEAIGEIRLTIQLRVRLPF